MRRSAVNMSPARLRGALRKITEVLAGGLSHENHTVPQWSEREWLLAQAVAAMHGISPLLSRKLRWRGPSGWVEFLDAQRTHTERRHIRILELLQNLDEALRAKAIGAVALKGVALHRIGLYQPGERPMADVDLLVHPKDSQRTARLIESLGFHESLRSWRERVFTPNQSGAAAELGEHAGNAVKIELHERICERLPLRLAEVSEAVLPGTMFPGLNDYPSTAALMTHLLLHASGSIAYQSLRLLHLHDLALLSARMSAQDWEALMRLQAPGRSMHWAWPPLAMTGRYYALQAPQDVLKALRSSCPRLLREVSRRRRVSDVSYSYPRVDAFPGIEWSQSLPEMAAFILSRVRPSREHVALRETTSLTQAWAAGARWSSLSQVHRIARWIVARPVRPATLHAVKAALAQMR
jgi:Uncharacterised nucleotidyltransferase